MNNLDIHFEDDVITTGIYIFKIISNKNSIMPLRKTNKSINNKSINNKSQFPNIVKEDKLIWRLDELLQEISISKLLKPNRVCCFFLHVCRGGETNGYSSNNNNAIIKHGISILPQLEFIPENSHNKYKNKTTNFNTKMNKLYKTINAYQRQT